MPRQSAGLLCYRRRPSGLEVFLAHPGGPFWARKDEGAWSIPKGELEEGEDARATALREFAEETGFAVTGPLRPLEPVRQAGGKVVQAWAVEADFDAGAIVSSTFTIEWPPRSGQRQDFPEIDRAAWFTLDQARRKILPGQAPLIDQIQHL